MIAGSFLIHLTVKLVNHPNSIRFDEIEFVALDVRRWRSIGLPRRLPHRSLRLPTTFLGYWGGDGLEGGDNLIR